MKEFRHSKDNLLNVTKLSAEENQTPTKKNIKVQTFNLL